MNLLIKEKGSGKTTGLIYSSESTRYPIVTSSKIQACYIKDMAKEMNCDIPDPLTVDDLRLSGALPSFANVLFDNVETILEAAINSYLGVNVVCATMTDLKKESEEKLSSQDEEVNE